MGDIITVYNMGEFVPMSMTTKFHNDINTVALRGFTATEKDLLYTLMSIVKDTGTTQITLDYSKLREKSGYDKTIGVKKFQSDLKLTNKKLMSLHASFIDGDEEVMFVLFPTFRTNVKKQTLTIQVHELFEYLLNGLNANFTKFELKEFLGLTGGYAKDLYRFLKQFRKTGLWHVKIEDFRELLNVPKSYKLSNIDNKVLEPAIKQLRNCFKGLWVEKVYARKPGKPVTHLKFRFKEEDDFDADDSKTFRDENGNYYYKHLMDLDGDEIAKAFPEVIEY